MPTEVTKEVRKFRVKDSKIKGQVNILPVTLTYKGGRIEMQFPFNRTLTAEIKAMQGHKWHGYDEINPRKVWSVVDSPRNRFRIAFMSGENPYARYERPLAPVADVKRPLREHQHRMLSHALYHNYVIVAGEMGTGKSLVMVELLDHIADIRSDQVWYIGPRSGVVAVRREFVKWGSKFNPKFMTYNGLVTAVREWEPGMPAPRVVFFDESSKIKTPTSQRSQAALHLANAVRREWGEDGYIILASGTPAPKAPTDWWHQSEVACPGFLREGEFSKFKSRLQIVEMRPSIDGGTYPHPVTWLDDEAKCGKCGMPEIDVKHTSGFMEFDHAFVPSVNEVKYLHQRIKDLALIVFKKDCLDLPEKQYRLITVRPSVDTLRAAKLIRKTVPRAVTALSLLRELSDGFQYHELPTGEKEACPRCKGRKKYIAPRPTEDVDPMAPQEVNEADFKEVEIDCTLCDADGRVDKMRRGQKEFETPKDEAFIELLDDHDDGGRFVAWGGFTATIDRLVRICHQQGWATLRVDGRGLVATMPDGTQADSNEFLSAMDAGDPKRQDLLDKYPKICVVGHPKAGGMALTFNISPTALFFSNEFDGEARMQAEDRIHRMGMDSNRGCTIIDLVHLPSDLLVLNNLKKKKDLQNLSMGELDESFEHLPEPNNE